MRNEQYTLHKQLPKGVRLFCYKEALDYFENPKSKYKNRCGGGLCILLPIVLWDLKDYSENIDKWNWLDTPIAFPELTKEVVTEIAFSNARSETRIKFLKQAIKQLES